MKALIALCMVLLFSSCDFGTGNPVQTQVQQSSSSQQIPISYAQQSSSSSVIQEVSHPILVDVFYTSSSEMQYGRFFINATIVNVGVNPIQFTNGKYAIYGSSGGILTDIVKTADNSMVGTIINPGSSYKFMLEGYSNSYIPYSWSYQLSFTDGVKSVTNDYTGLFNVLLNRKAD